MSTVNINGVNLYYELLGEKNTLGTVAFFNGVMATTNSWVYQVPLFLKLGYQILLHDFKGQLKSDKPVGPYTFKDHAIEAKALMDELGIKKVHLIGTSYGGEVAMKFAILYPEYVKSISIIDSVSELDDNLKWMVQGWKNLAKGDPVDFFWGMAPSIYGNTFLKNNRETLEKRAQTLTKVPNDYFTGQIYLYDTFINDVFMTDELNQILCPALVVCGEDDILKKPKFSKIIANKIPNSEYALIPDCGHVTIFEKPNILNSLLLGFVVKYSD